MEMNNQTMLGGAICESGVLGVCLITKLLSICAPLVQLSICLHIINYLAERFGWKEYGRETQLESCNPMPSENPTEPQRVKRRNDWQARDKEVNSLELSAETH